MVVESFVPGNSLPELTSPNLHDCGQALVCSARVWPFIRNSLHGIQHALGRIHPIQIFGDLCAQKTTRDRMFRIALDPGGPPVLTVIRTPQASGQSCGQAALTVCFMRFIDYTVV